MKKDTLRLLITKKCNFNCGYCCNDMEEFNCQFSYKRLDEIDFDKYESVCLTGGEPFLKRDFVFYLLEKKIPHHMPVYIYTNGVLVNALDILNLESFENVKSLNIGLHFVNQLKSVHTDVGTRFPARFHIQDTKIEKFLERYPDRLSESNIRVWSMNDCNMPNEDWVVLKA